MLIFFLLLSLFLLFYSLTVGEYPDPSSIKEAVLRFALPGGGAVAFFIVASALFKTPIAGLFWAIFGWFVPGWIIEAVKERRQTRLRNLAKDFVASAAGLYAVGQMTSEVVRVMAERFPEPFASEFRDMIAVRNMNPHASFPRMFDNLAEKYGLSEFKAVSTILAASERAGGPLAASRGLKRLGAALRQRDRLLMERAKAIMEPKIAAVATIAILSVGLLLDATAFGQYFEGIGRIVVAASSALLVGLVFMTKRIAQSKDLI